MINVFEDMDGDLVIEDELQWVCVCISRKEAEKVHAELSKLLNKEQPDNVDSNTTQ